MNVSCPECRSVFRVDPTKVPPAAVRARCSVCGGVITVTSGASPDDEFSSNSSISASGARASGASERATSARGNAGFANALMDAFAAPPAAVRQPTPATSAPAMAPAADVSRAPSVNNAAAPARAGAPATAQPSKQAPAAPAAANKAPSSASNAPTARPVLFPPRPMMPGGATTGAPSRPLVAPRGAANSSAPGPSAAGAPRPSGSLSASAASAHVPPAAPPAPQAAPQPAAAPTASPGAAPASARTPINPFLANDPHAKAKRLARALISDLVTYFPQKRQDGLRDGTLKQLFKEEIQKSHEEYVAQVGKEFAESTPHFQDALNDLLAGGQKVF